MTSPRVRAGLVVGFVFAAGLLGGVALERHYFKGPTPTLSPEEAHESAMADLVETLELDADQVARVHAILAEHHAVVEGAWEQLRPQIQTAMADVNHEIAALLRPEQRERFHEWLTERSEQGTTFTFHER